MYQKDYILRMIEMLARLIAGILGLIKNGNYKQASDQLEIIYYDMLKEDASFFRAIPEEKLTQKLLQEHNYTNGHLEILAELFNTVSSYAVASLCHYYLIKVQSEGKLCDWMKILNLLLLTLKKMEQIGRILIVTGIILVVAGLILYFAGNKLSWLGHLPGDIR